MSQGKKIAFTAEDEKILRDTSISAKKAGLALGCAATTVRHWRDRHGVLTRRYWHGCQETCPEYCPYEDCMMPQDIAILENENEMRARAKAAMKPITRKRKAVDQK